jgi:arginase
MVKPAGEFLMIRPKSIIGAPSSIGIRPYDDGTPRRLDLAPAALRKHDLAARIGVSDLGDVVSPPYRDFVRTAGKPRNEAEVAVYSRALASRVVAGVPNSDAFLLLLGGDCSIVLGALLGFRLRGHARVGLVYVDAHADFATPDTSRTGSAASMCLALAVGRGDTPLARLDGASPLVREEDVVIIGRHDDTDGTWYGEDVLRSLPLLDLPRPVVRDRGPTSAAEAALERVGRAEVDGFWIHVDADVLDPTVLPAVDSPEPGGLTLEELTELLIPLARHPMALGLELTIYDPALDADGASGERLVSLLERVLGSASAPTIRSPYWEELARSH